MRKTFLLLLLFPALAFAEVHKCMTDEGHGHSWQPPQANRAKLEQFQIFCKKCLHANAGAGLKEFCRGVAGVEGGTVSV